MAKPGAWGGGGVALPRIVRRTNVIKNTVTEPEAEEAQGPAPLLKYTAEPQVTRGVLNPELQRLSARGMNNKTGMGR